MPHQEGVHVTWFDAEIRLSLLKEHPYGREMLSQPIREFHPLDYCVRGLEVGDEERKIPEED